MRPANSAVLGAIFLIATCVPAPAHEGHDHDIKPAPLSGTASPRGEASSDAFELIAVARGDELSVYLDRFATNEPIDGAVIEVETPHGPATATARSGEAYLLKAPWLATPGRFDLIFTVTFNGTVDVLPLMLDTTSPVTPAEPTSVLSFAQQSLPDGLRQVIHPALLTAGLVGFLLGLLLRALSRRRRRNAAALILVGALASIAVPGTDIQPAMAHEGEDHGDQPARPQTGGELAQRLADGTLFVPKAIQRIFALRTALTETAIYRRSIELPGRIIPDPNASGYVQAAIGGRLSPPPGGFPRLGTKVNQGDVLAYVTPPLQAIDVSTMRQQQGDLDQQISLVERRLARYEQIGPIGVPRAQVEDARLELKGLKERRASLDHVRRQPEELVAPVSGIVADGNPIAGQIAQPNAMIFHIIDPARLWVEALSFDAVAPSQGASALTAGGRKLTLTHRGSGFADRSQSIPIHFAIEDDAAGLRAGQFVTVFVAADGEKPGIAIPRTSVVRGANGQDFVFEHVAAEQFVPRAVRVEPLDGERVLVMAGIGETKRIVVQGAELLDHVR